MRSEWKDWAPYNGRASVWTVVFFLSDSRWSRELLLLLTFVSCTRRPWMMSSTKMHQIFRYWQHNQIRQLSPLKKHYYRHNFHLRVSKIGIYSVETQRVIWIGSRSVGAWGEVVNYVTISYFKAGNSREVSGPGVRKESMSRLGNMGAF